LEAAMHPSEIERVEAYLRRLLGSERVQIAAPRNRDAPVEVLAGQEFIGTLHRDEEDGEVAYSLYISILEEDLPPYPIRKNAMRKKLASQ
jgi:hypothetical protein